MILLLAYLAAFGCAIFNGSAAVLEKIGADKEERAKSSNFSLLWRLKSSGAFILGVVFDFVAFALTLYAVHYLPIFMVQPIIACSIIVTALIEHFLFKRRITNKFIIAAVIIIFGLVFIGLSANSDTAKAIGEPTKLLFVLTPIALFMLGSFFAKINHNNSTLVLAAISGLAFGGISVAGRSLQTNNISGIFTNPLSWSIIGYGLTGILFFTIALQRASATLVSAIMIAFETLSPILAGIVFLADRPRNNLWPTLIIGISMAFSGTILIALMQSKKTKSRK